VAGLGGLSMKRSGMLRPTAAKLSHDTERYLKTKTTNLHGTPPLIMHSVCAQHERGIEDTKKIPESESLSQASWMSIA